MTSAQLEALKAGALGVVTFAVTVGLIAAPVGAALPALVGALGVVAAAFLVKQPQNVEKHEANAALAAVVHDVARRGDHAVVDIPLGDETVHSVVPVEIKA